MNHMIKNNKSSNNEQGMALVVVLMVLVVVSILGLCLMGFAANNLKMSTGERNNQSAYYIAESGATFMMSDVTKNIKEAYNSAKTRDEFYTLVQTKFNANNFFIERDVTSFEKNFGQQPIAKVKVQAVDLANGKYKIISTGTLNNRTRTVEQEFKLVWSVEFPKTAVFVDNTITIDSGSAIINGSIGTNSAADGSITLHDSSSLQSGAEIIVGPNARNQGQYVVDPNIFTNIKVLEEKISLELKPFKETPTLSYPDSVRIFTGTTSFVDKQVKGNNGNLSINEGNDTIATLNMTDTMVLNDFKIYDKNTLNINIGDKNLEMFVNNLDVSGTLNIVGTGTLSIYVSGNLSFQNGVINQIEDQKDNLIIYLRKSTTPTPKVITATSTPTGINCNIFAEDAKFDFTGGTFRGRFVTGGSVEIGGNNVIEGSIIAKSLLLKGNSSITFVEEDAILPLPSFKVNPLNPEPVRET